MIVIVAGMPRSGSTLTYNIAREFLIERYTVDPVLSNSLPKNIDFAIDTKKAILLKSHSPDKDATDLIVTGRALCICSMRKPEDAIASWMNAFGFSFEESIQHFEHWIAWHSSIAELTLNVDFTEIEKNLVGLIEKIGRYLKCDVSSDGVSFISKKYSKEAMYTKYQKMAKNESENIVDCGFSFYERDTLFHRRHVASLIPRRGSEILTRDQLEAFNARFARFLDGDGNYCWSNN